MIVGGERSWQRGGCEVGRGSRYPPARGEVKHLRGKPTEDERSLSPGMEMSELGLPVTGDPRHLLALGDT